MELVSSNCIKESVESTHRHPSLKPLAGDILRNSHIPPQSYQVSSLLSEKSGGLQIESQREIDPFGLRVSHSLADFGTTRRANVAARLCRSSVTSGASRVLCSIASTFTLTCRRCAFATSRARLRRTQKIRRQFAGALSGPARARVNVSRATGSLQTPR